MATQLDPEAQAVLRLRITHITSTMSQPLPSLQAHYMPPHLATAVPPGSSPHHLPVLRIFGITPALQKICANIHLCYPYFFVPFPMDTTDPLRPERVVKLCQRFAVSLNHAVCLAMRQNPTAQANTSKYGGGTDPQHLHVASVLLVKGVPFYGYHVGYSYFLKVSLVNPARMYVALEQLRKPVVLGREWQPHEAHMSHVSQFMCDFDLYGCGWLELGGGTFRDPLPEGDPYVSPPSTHSPYPVFNTLTVPEDMMYTESLSPPKETFTPLEIDVLPHHILNRRRLKPRDLHHDFIELLHRPLDPDEKLVPAVAELWEDERRRRSNKGLSLSERAMMPGSGGMSGRSKEELGYQIQGNEYEKNKGGKWKISDELWEMIEERMSEERRRRGRLTYERFSADTASGKGGQNQKYDKWIMTTFLAVSAHWPRQPKPSRNTQRSRRSRKSFKTSSVMRPSSPLLGVIEFSQAKGLLPSSSPVNLGSPMFDLKEDLDEKQNIIEMEGIAQPPAAMDGEGGVDHGEVSSSDDDEENPFEALALSQASQGPPDVEADVNPRLIQRSVREVEAEDLDEEELNQQLHERDARQHAEEGARLRATQGSSKHDGLSDEYDDAELDELFRRTVVPGWRSNQTTPRKRGINGSMTPTTGSRTAASGSGGPMSRGTTRDRRMREMAGLADLSTIIDRSSVSISPRNAYNPLEWTPTKLKTPSSETAVTPTSLIRNLFARNRPSVSPYESPSKRSDRPGVNTVILPQSKKSLATISPSPDSDEERAPTPVPIMVRNPHESMTDVKPRIGSVNRDDMPELDLPLPPPQRVQFVDNSPLSENKIDSKKSSVLAPLKRSPSPTFRNDDPMSEEIAEFSGETSGIPRNKKRVRLASTESGLAPLQPHTSQAIVVVPVSTSGTATSNGTAPSVLTDGSLSTIQSKLSSTSWEYRSRPPFARDVAMSINPQVIYLEPYYSNPVDVPRRAKMFGGRMFTLKGNAVKELPAFESTSGEDRRWLKIRKTVPEKSRYGWEYTVAPPTLRCVLQWCTKEDLEIEAEAQTKSRLTSQPEGPIQRNRYGFKFSQKKKTKDSEREHQNMSVLAIEVFAKSRHQLLPDPEKDEVTAVFYCYQNEDENLPDTTSHSGYHAGFVVVDSPQVRHGRLGMGNVPCHVVDSELDLINWMIDTVQNWDPDVLAGWELHNSSWGWLAARANESFSIDLMEQLSRVLSGHAAPRKDFYSATHSSTFKVSGRHILNIWRICRSEINLTQYSFENIVFHFLHQRIPHYSSANLTVLWKSKAPEHTNRVLKHFFQRVVMDMEIVDAAEIITKTAEFARVFGVDFTSVMFRGSQFKVESFMFRIAKPESFVLVSPSKQQVGLQNAPFAVPLIAEPESKYYTHPILVLDFQSLYPSVMIAYNLCFSTCLGRVEKFKGTDKFGFTELKVTDGLLELLQDYLTVTPNGMIFVKPAVRKSLLAKMLGEILDTRVMVKHAMKGACGDKSLLSLLNARQLGLKLMANVTYGYTSATYSGRMPCIEVADSIVQTGRETLEKAQELIHSRADWGAQVVYGDTDSLFVALPGRSKDEAFKIGHDIADTVTATNPKPIKLKFEKVYMGSVLMAKKRYVGFKYEHPDDVEPTFDAKGIETIRRDGFPAQQKIEEVCLKMLFQSQDLSQIKEYCRQEWTKILQGRVSMQDFVVAKEVRLGSYSEKGVPPPGAAVAYRRILRDPRDEPQYAERVPYIVSNADGRRLIDRARMPEEMLSNRSLGIDAEYYIRNLLVPPLSRIFNLVGADVENWYDSMPRTKRAGKYDAGDWGKMRIDSHFRSNHCMVCGSESSQRVCGECRSDPSITTHALLSRDHLAQDRLVATHKICASCSSTPVQDRILCDSIDCPVMYARVAAQRDVDDLADVSGIIQELSVQDNVIREASGDEKEWNGALDW